MNNVPVWGDQPQSRWQQELRDKAIAEKAKQEALNDVEKQLWMRRRLFDD